MGQVDAVDLHGLVGLLIASNSDESAGVGEPQHDVRHAGHPLVNSTAVEGEALEGVTNGG